MSRSVLQKEWRQHTSQTCRKHENIAAAHGARRGQDGGSCLADSESQQWAVAVYWPRFCVFLTLWKLLGAQNCLAIVHHTYEVLKVLVNVLCSRHYFLKFCIVYFRCVQVWERRLSKCLCVCHPTLISVCCEYTYTASHLQPGWFLEPNAEFFPEPIF